MDRIEHLKEIYENRQSDEDFVRDKIQEHENKYFFIPGLEGTNIVFAIYSIYILHDIQKAKLYFHRAASIAKYMSDNYNARIMDTGIYQMSYALLSDDKDLIKSYSVLKNPVNNVLSLGFQLPNAVQNILLSDWEKLDENIRNLKRFVKLPRFKAYEPTVDLFIGFKYKDIEGIKTALQKLLETNEKRTTDPLISRFLSVDVAGYCKLAWILGYEIDLKNDLVPKRLMIVQPLLEYMMYDLLN
jgi:hypothetical protein